MRNEAVFLSVDDVIEIHSTQMAVYGGTDGVRDMGLLESAVAQSQATFDDQLVHNGLFEMAAAYIVHIVSNHPFIEGNKRTGLLAAIVFLDLNGVSIAHPSDALYELTMSIASGPVDKSLVALELMRIANAPATPASESAG